MKQVIIHDTMREYDGFFKIDKTRLQFEKKDGTLSDVVTKIKSDRGDAVAVLLFHSERNKVLFTKQFRYPVMDKTPNNGYILEIPAGKIDAGEKPEDAARREVNEEMGYVVDRLQFIATVFTSPGGSSERIHVYYAQVRDSHRQSEGGGLASENEDIEIIEMSPGEISNAIDDGTICDAKTLMSLFWASF